MKNQFIRNIKKDKKFSTFYRPLLTYGCELWALI